MHGLNKRHATAWMVSLFLLGAACGPVSRVEPAVGGRPEMVDRITGSWKEAEDLDRIRAAYSDISSVEPYACCFQFQEWLSE